MPERLKEKILVVSLNTSTGKKSSYDSHKPEKCCTLGDTGSCVLV